MIPNHIVVKQDQRSKACRCSIIPMFQNIVVCFKKQNQKPVDAALSLWFQMFSNVVVYFKERNQKPVDAAFWFQMFKNKVFFKAFKMLSNVVVYFYPMYKY